MELSEDQDLHDTSTGTIQEINGLEGETVSVTSGWKTSCDARLVVGDA